MKWQPCLSPKVSSPGPKPGNGTTLVGLMRRYGLVVRIPGSHPGGPGSIPGNGKSFEIKISDEDGIRTHAGRAHWISSPTP